MRKGEFCDGTLFIEDNNIYILFEKEFGVVGIKDFNISNEDEKIYYYHGQVVGYLKLTKSFYYKTLIQLGATKKEIDSDYEVAFIQDEETWEKVVDWIFSVITMNKMIE